VWGEWGGVATLPPRPPWLKSRAGTEPERSGGGVRLKLNRVYVTLTRKRSCIASVDRDDAASRGSGGGKVDKRVRHVAGYHFARE
jgi:hypothetical protein